MSKNIISKIIRLLCLLIAGLIPAKVYAQDSLKSPLIVTLSYFSCNNTVQYIAVSTKSKATGKFQPVPGVAVSLFLNKDSSGKPAGFIGKVITDEKGRATSGIPASLAQIWKTSANHTFIAVTGKTKLFEETSTEIIIAKSRLTIDTTNDKNVTATFEEFKNGTWVAQKGVEIKLGVKRLDADLLINDDQSYTTDSLGRVKGEFKRVGIPGDKAGNLILVAKVDDNDQYGNLRIEKSTPWAVKFVAGKDFFHRALWASRFHSPVWLVVIAYAIIIGVWGTIIYLVFLLLKIRRLGRE